MVFTIPSVRVRNAFQGLGKNRGLEKIEAWKKIEAWERMLDQASKKACPEGMQVQGPSGAYPYIQ
jgi:hypothetical protein